MVHYIETEQTPKLCEYVAKPNIDYGESGWRVRVGKRARGALEGDKVLTRGDAFSLAMHIRWENPEAIVWIIDGDRSEIRAMKS